MISVINQLTETFHSSLNSHQVQLVFVFCVILQCVYVAIRCKQVEHFLYGLVVGHVAYKQLYLGGVRVRRLPPTTRRRERCAVSDSLV